MNTVFRIGLALWMLFVLIGCNDVEEKNPSKSTTENNNISSTPGEEETPPALKLTIGEVEIKTYRGAYTWSYVDKSTGQEVMTQTDHAPPTEMVVIEQGVSVDLSEPVKINFKIEPTQYVIRVWDKQNVIATYNTFEEIEEKGKYIFEIVGTWGDSRATYVGALDLQ